MKLPEITIIGLGGLAQTLLEALLEHNYPIKSIFNRTPEKAHRLSRENDIAISAAFPSDIEQLGQIVFLTVSDSAITKVASGLGELGNSFNDKKVVHCSGNEPADLLQCLKDKGAAIASFHPLQTFSAQSNAQDFNDIFFSMQGDEIAFPTLRNIAKELGAYTLRVNEEQKSHLHTAAVMASNYLITLINASVKTAAYSGLNEQQVADALFPLIKTTLKNAENGLLPEVLTGPIKRGDVETVRNHLTLLKEKPELLKMYNVLGEQTVDLAHASGYLKKADAQKMSKILQDF